jgi:hypothetical protein
MAILGYLTTSRECLQVEYQSEPVLVHAARRLFNESSSGATTEMLSALNDLAKEGLVAEGPLGELAARFILLRALSESGRERITAVQINIAK